MDNPLQIDAPQTDDAKNSPLNRPHTLAPTISPPGACTWKIALKYKVKQSRNGKFYFEL